MTSDTLLDELKLLAERFAASHLESYVERLERDRIFPTVPKEINDAIWGTIKLHPFEVAIVDSPLLQRLRFIRQLGVVHWIYPGAVHTRFEHTLGVLHQVQQLVTAINDVTPADCAPAIGPKEVALLRLCALMHDTGHSVFSHVSEHAIVQNDELRLALTRFSRNNKIEKVQLSELMAYFVVGSPIFKRLLELLLENVPTGMQFASGSRNNAFEIVNRVRNAIVGKSICDQVPLLHELISGAYDADKLDYFVRDARLAGIPAVLDISRLLQKISVRVVSPRELPQRIAAQVRATQTQCFLFGLKWSGAAVLDELHLARVLLYAKIYRHTKVMAIEAMIEAWFESLSRSDGVNALDLVRLAYLFTDDQLIWSESADLFKRANLSPPPQTLRVTEELQKRLRDRNVFVYALAVRASYPGDQWADDPTQSAGLKRFVADLNSPDHARVFRANLMSEVQAIGNLAGLEIGILAQMIVVSAKTRTSGGTEIDRAFVFQGDKNVTYRDLSGVNRPAWADAYHFSAASALVFCPREIAPASYIAVEKIIREKYDIILPKAARELSKLQEADVANLKERLEGVGYYDDVPYDIRPLPKRLENADIQTFLDEISVKLKAVDEPPAEVGQRRPKTLRGRVLDWLSQFRTEENIECAMEVLRRIRIISREDTGRALINFAKAYPKFKGATIVVLGQAKDSGAIQAYYSRDVADLFPRVLTLEKAADERIDAPVVFVDDFIGSGGQLDDMLGTGFDVEDLKRGDLNEQRDLFTDSQQEYLKSRPVGFVFVAGWKSGEARLAEACKKIGLDATLHIDLEESEIPFAFENCLQEIDPENVRAFKSRCQEIGNQLLIQSGEEKAKQRSLGYGNRAMLLLSRYNVPTQVLTCFWHGGKLGNVEWHPLINRRPKN